MAASVSAVSFRENETNAADRKRLPGTTVCGRDASFMVIELLLKRG
jgi:hypothetical protein